jgi:lysophospholipase L1-like esterase
MQIGKSIAVKYGVPFFDYSHDETLISRPELFSDFLHLNDKGARIFSEMVIDRILKERQYADSSAIKN